jgi:hypothetical protein
MALIPYVADAKARTANTIAKGLARAVLFILTLCIACPVRYYPLVADFDNSWVFGINYAAAHEFLFGRDLVFVTGPIGYLVFPQDVGHNLATALIYQLLTWLVIGVILWDLYFPGGFRLRNLAAFTVCLGVAAPLFWLNRVGLENLLLACALICLILYRVRGGMWRYVVGLMLLGLTPMIKLTSAMIAIGLLCGFLAFRFFRKEGNLVLEAILAATVTSAVALFIGFLTMPGLSAFEVFVRGSLESAGGFSSAMSYKGNLLEFFLAGQILLLLGILLVRLGSTKRDSALFLIFLLGIPLAISFKHGFVRQDIHVINFFCFAALCAGLTALLSSFQLMRSLPILAWMLATVAQGVYTHEDFRDLAMMGTGARGVVLLWQVRNMSSLQASLRRESARNITTAFRLEPEIRAAIADSPVTVLSNVYNGAVLFDELRFVPFPVVARINAYTPYLDEFAAKWVREKAPGFLVFDGSTIDRRHPWAETPATWLEVYRWYDTRLLGERNLLLQRRQQPRFTRLTPIGREHFALRDTLTFREARQPVFWTMTCGLRTTGKLRKLLYHIPAVMMRTDRAEEPVAEYRVIPELLAAPVLGPSLPANLAEFAVLLRESGVASRKVKSLSFGGPGLKHYGPNCEVEFLEPDGGWQQ